MFGILATSLTGTRFQPLREPCAVAIPGIGQRDTSGQASFDHFSDLSRRDFGLGQKAERCRHAGFAPLGAVGRPRLGQITAGRRLGRPAAPLPIDSEPGGSRACPLSTILNASSRPNGCPSWEFRSGR